MRVYFGGAEKGSYRSTLLTAGVERFAVNLTHYPIPKKKSLDLKEQFRGNEVVLYTSENDEDVARYDQFIREHVDSLTYVIGRPDYDGKWLSDKYVPIWNDPDDLDRLVWLCQKNSRVAISDRAITGKNLQRIAQIATRWQTSLIGLTSKPDLIERLPWEAVIVGSWSSAIRYGETQVWDGHRLHRYPAQQKESARRRHRADIQRLGLSHESVMEDDVNEVALLSIRSWQAWEQATFGGYEPMNIDDENEWGTPSNDQNIVTWGDTPTPPNVAQGGSNIVTHVPEKRHPNDKRLLPVMGLETITSMGSKTVEDGEESIEIAPEEINVLRYNADPLRQCNHCYLASRCPSFQENSECAFSLPVEIRTKDQFQAAMRAMIEMQVGRIMFARFAEELEGQGLDSNLSSEMDRLFDIMERMKDISDTRDFIRFEVEAKGQSGVLSRLFGAKAGEQARMLPNGGLGPQATDALYGEIIDVPDEG